MGKPTYPKMGARIAELRIERAYSQSEVAKQLGVYQSTISAWETGRWAPDHENVRRIADFFGVSPGYVRGVSDDRAAPPDHDDAPKEATAAEVPAAAEVPPAAEESTMEVDPPKHTSTLRPIGYAGSYALYNLRDGGVILDELPDAAMEVFSSEQLRAFAAELIEVADVIDHRSGLPEGSVDHG